MIGLWYNLQFLSVHFPSCDGDGLRGSISTAEVATLDVGLQLQSLNQSLLVHVHTQRLLQRRM